MGSFDSGGTPRKAAVWPCERQRPCQSGSRTGVPMRLLPCPVSGPGWGWGLTCHKCAGSQYLLMGRIHWMRALTSFAGFEQAAACPELAQSPDSSVCWDGLTAVTLGTSPASLGHLARGLDEMVGMSGSLLVPRSLVPSCLPPPPGMQGSWSDLPVPSPQVTVGTPRGQ